MSTARLLENRALPDIDFNVVSQEPFQKASKELLGEHGCYPMVAYGTMKDGEAFRNVCRSHDIPYDDFNEVAKNIDDYAEDPKWKPLIEESKKSAAIEAQLQDPNTDIFTGLPFKDNGSLSDAEKEDFTNDVKQEVEKAYPTQKNGEIIFRFPRLFFIAKRS